MTKITIETDWPDLERLIFMALETWADPARVTKDDLAALDALKVRVDKLDPVP